MLTSDRARTYLAANRNPAEKRPSEFTGADLAGVAQYTHVFARRDITLSGYIVTDPNSAQTSKPNCVAAPPSYLRQTPGADQDCVFNRVKDAWEHPSLFVVGAGSFVTIGASTLTLTIAARAPHTAGRIFAAHNESPSHAAA